MDNKNVIIVNAEMAQLDTITSWLETGLEACDCPLKLVMKILVCVEELFVNVVNYAYGDSTGTCTVIMEQEDGDDECQVCIQIRDGGMPFDPFAKEDPDITLSAEEREIGGLGIYMVKNIMDTVSYEYKQNENTVTMKKKWQK